MLKVSEYLTSGLVVSAIDKWFLGPVPTFRPESIGPEPHSDLYQAIEDARKLALDSSKLTWPPVSGFSFPSIFAGCCGISVFVVLGKGLPRRMPLHAPWY